jgi:aspartate aminotransferase-like enzyme
MIVSSQKGLALAPGLAMVWLGRAVIEERVQRINPSSLYFDLRDALVNANRGQTPFTPAVGVVYQLYDRLLGIHEQGLERELQTVALLARDVRERLRSLPVSTPAYPLSNALTPVLFEDGIASEVFKALLEDYDILVTPNGGALASRLFRIGHIGVHTVEENEQLCSALGEVVMRIRNGRGS